MPSTELTVSGQKFSIVAEHWPALQTAALLASNMAYVGLVPSAQIPALVAELDRALTTATLAESEAFTRRLLGSYGNHNLHEADTWSRAVISVFATYPASLGWRAVDALTLRLKWVPSRADVAEALEGLRRPLLEARAMALAMEREHQRRSDDAAMQAALDANRAAFKAEHGDKSILEVIREQHAKEASHG